MEDESKVDFFYLIMKPPCSMLREMSSLDYKEWN